MFKLILITAFALTSIAEARQAPWVRNRRRIAEEFAQEEIIARAILLAELQEERGPQGIDEQIDALQKKCVNFCFWVARKTYTCCCRRPRR